MQGFWAGWAAFWRDPRVIAVQALLNSGWGLLALRAGHYGVAVWSFILAALLMWIMPSKKEKN